jgi:hypothetical protein
LREAGRSTGAPSRFDSYSRSSAAFAWLCFFLLAYTSALPSSVWEWSIRWGGGFASVSVPKPRISPFHRE